MTRLTRRGLLRSGAAAGVLAASGLPLQAQMQRGGRLRAALGGAHASDSWDARSHRDSFMQIAGQGAVFDTLTEVAADGTLKGELAENWEASANARVWTFTLRRGVTFHNGKPFGADDMIASLRLHMGTASPARPILSGITGLTKLGAHQVQLVLEAGNADLPYLLSDYHLLMYPAGQIDEAIAKGIGTGLYRVEHFAPGVRFLGRRVEGHYKDGKAGWFDEVEFWAMNDPAARMQALLEGKVDAINRVDPRQAGKIRGAHRLQEVAGNRHLSFAMRSDRAPLDDVNLRRAMKHGIDREDMLKRILKGHGRVGHDSPIGPANPYFTELDPVPHDPDKAAYYLRQAGVEALRVDLSASAAAFEGAEAAARLYQSAAKPAGVHINLVSEASRRTPVSAAAWAGRATEDWMFSTGYAGGVPWNDGHWQDARFDRLLSEARAEMDSVRRGEIYGEMQRMLRDDGPAVIPVFANWVQAVSARLSVPDRVGNLWDMDNARMAERWAMG